MGSGAKGRSEKLKRRKGLPQKIGPLAGQDVYAYVPTTDAFIHGMFPPTLRVEDSDWHNKRKSLEE